MSMVSAIITTYKRCPELLERAAKSILNQTYKNIELIIVDDSPQDYELRDAVRDMAESLGENVSYIRHEVNMGACAARNTGLNAAKGEFVAFLDDDDEWLPKKIELQMEKIKNSDVALVYCGPYLINEENKTKIEKKDVLYKKGRVYDELIYRNFIGSTSYPLIRKSVLIELGGFDVKMKAAQDFEMWLRIAQKYDVDYVAQPLVNYYIHAGDQITKNRSYKVEAYERLREKNIDYLEKHPKAYAVRLLQLALVCVNVDVEKGKKALIMALKKYPLFSLDVMRAIKWLYIMPLIQKIKR